MFRVARAHRPAAKQRAFRLRANESATYSCISRLSSTRIAGAMSGRASA
jgi:hypothetical protein